ncbi:MAG: hypothetical protein BGO96_01000 [Micrococcales bacterium 73-15]|nr:MAG: hypothetical protein BGO96_01000 [Micrococcales bacterium 73-15]
MTAASRALRPRCGLAAACAVAPVNVATTWRLAFATTAAASTAPGWIMTEASNPSNAPAWMSSSLPPPPSSAGVPSSVTPPGSRPSATRGASARKAPIDDAAMTL